MGEGAAVDWARWHDRYDEDSPLARRLVVVQDRIRELLDGAAEGPIRIVSICAGQGRDLLPVLAGHPRREDVHARLVELDARNVAVVPEVPNVEVVCGDAAVLGAYEGAVPAEIVIACGVFGNIPAGEIRRTIEHLPMLCSRDAAVIWTRSPRRPDLCPAIRGWFAAYGFDEQFFFVEPEEFGVGVHRLTDAPQPLDPGVKLFTFVR
jgi:hypothetical protein